MLNVTSYFKRIQLVFLLFLFSGGFYFSSYSQNQIQWVPKPNQNIMACDTAIFPFQLVKTNGSSFVATQELTIDLQLPNWVDLVSAQGDQIQLNQQSQHQINATISSSGSSDTLSLLLKVVASCQSFSLSPNQTANITGNATLAQGGINLSSANLSGRSLMLQRGILALASVNNKNSVTSLYGKVQRCYTYTNTSTSDSLSIDIEFKDSIRYQDANNWVRLFDVSVQNSPYVNLTNSSVSDTIVSINLTITKLPPLASIVICDSIQLTTCPKTGTDSTLTEFSLSYGCIADSLCQNLTDPINNLSSVAIDNSRPIISKVLTNTDRTCPSDSNIYRWRIWNSGNAIATGASFSWYYLFSQTISNIDTNSIQFYRLNGSGQKSPISYHKIPYYSRVPYGPGKEGRNVYHLTLDDSFQPSDTFYLEYREYEACPNSSNFDNLLGRSFISMYDHTLMARLDHPCRPNTNVFKLYTSNNTFQLGQYTDNLIGTMEDQQKEWFEIKNNGRLVIFNSYYYTSPIYNSDLYYDPDRFRISIDVALDSGLCFNSADSLFIVSSNGDTLFPVTIDHRAGTTVGVSNQPQYCTKDTLTANFRLPANFFTAPTTGNPKPTPDYFSFFNDFSVWFQLKADCGFVDFSSGKKAKFEQTVYALIDTTCQTACRIPLHRVADEIQINCPGCYVPGWNLTAFDIERLNIGGSDTNNNHFPDFIPNPKAQSNELVKSRIIIGDTVGFNIEAFVSDGDEIDGYTLAQLGYPFKEGILYIDNNPLLQNLELIGFSGVFKHSNYSAHNFTIDPSHPNWTLIQNHNVANGSLAIKLDSASWTDYYGFPAFDNYKGLDSIELQLRFAVKQNLTNSPILSLINRYELGAFIYMSGTPFNFNNPLQKQDILEIDQADLRNTSLYPISVLKDKLFWCTGWDGRVMGYGMSYKHTFGRKPLYYSNICKNKALTYSFAGSIGRNYLQFIRGQVPAALDIFPNELRNLLMLDSVRLELPNNYTVRGINLVMRTLVDIGNGTGVAYTSTPFPVSNIKNQAGFSHFDFAGLPNKWVTEPALLSNGQIDQSVYHSFFDESKSYNLDIFLDPIDCRDTTTGTQNLTMTSYIGNNPISNAPVTKTTNFPLRLSKPNFNATATSFDFDGLSDIAFNFNLNIGSIGADLVPNVFLYARSENGSVNITSTSRGNPNVTQPFVTLKQNTGNPSSPYIDLLSGGRTHVYRVSADYDCSTVDSVDVVWLYFGYSCTGNVTAFGPEICAMDSISFTIVKQPAGVQATHTFPSDLELCDTNWHSININATGNQRVEEVKVNLTLPTGVSIADLNSNTNPSVELSFNGITQIIDGSLVTNGYEFDLTGLLTNFIGTAGQVATVRIPYLIDCSYTINNPFEIDITAKDYCGKDLQDINDLFLPSNVIGNYDFSQLQLNNLQVNLNNGNCLDTINFQTSIENLASNSSDGFLIEYYCLADTLGSLSSPCLIGSSNYNQIQANSIQTIRTSLAANCGACESVIAVIVPQNNSCYCGSVTDTLSAQVNCGCEEAEFTNCPDSLITVYTNESCSRIVNYTTSTIGSDTIQTTYIFSGASTGSGTGTGNGMSFNVGLTNVLLIASNSCGIDSCSFTIEVIDTIAPVALCQNITVQLDASGNTSITANDIDYGSSDACGIASLAIDHNLFDCSNLGVNTVSLTVTDNNGNTSSCLATVTVVDSIAPVALCQNITVQLDASGNVSITPNDIDAGSTDACGIASLTIDKDAFNCDDIGNNNVVLTVTDVNGNSSTCTAIVQVEDPSFQIIMNNCSSDISKSCKKANKPVYFDSPSAYGQSSICNSSCDTSNNYISGYIYLGYFKGKKYYCSSTNNFKWPQANIAATNHGGYLVVINSAAENAFIKQMLPSNAQAWIGYSDAASEGNFVWSNGENSTYTNWYTGGFWSEPNNSGKGANSSCGGADYTVIKGNNGKWYDRGLYARYEYIMEVPCSSSGVSVTQITGLVSGSVFPTGTTTVSFVALDSASGITDTCSFNVTIEADTYAPIARCKNVSVTLDTNGFASITGADINHCSIDKCSGIANLIASPSTFDSSAVGTNTVTLTVTDSAGNSSTCTATVTVIDPNAISYCNASGNSYYEWINAVNVGGTNSWTGNDGGYGDYTNVSFNVMKGNVSLRLTPGYRGKSYKEYWRVWIDYNRDGDFNDWGERVFQKKRKNTVYGSFYIPSSVQAGTYTMRIGMRYGGYPSTCGHCGYGEYEDYTINISSASTRNNGLLNAVNQLDDDSKEVFLFPNPSDGPFNLSLEGDYTEAVQISIRGIDGKLVLSKTVSAELATDRIQLNIKNQANGLYLLRVQSGDFIKIIKLSKL